MGGYRKFLRLTLQRWSRFVVVQNLSPLTPKESLETYFGQIAPVEGVRLIQNREKGGCYTRKALVLMKSQASAKRIIQEKRHRLTRDGCVTTVKYRGSVQKYNKGPFKVFVKLRLPYAEKSEKTRTRTAKRLTKKLARTYHGILYTSIKLDVDDKEYYDGLATVRFEHEFDEERVLGRTEENRKVVALWADTKAEDYCAKECRDKVDVEFAEKVGVADNDWDLEPDSDDEFAGTVWAWGSKSKWDSDDETDDSE